MEFVSRSTPDPSYLQALVDSIVETADPERIILFGSAAREQMQDDSDIDLLVVKDRCHRIHTAGRIYAKLPQKNTAVDIVIVWPEELVTNRNAPWGVIPPALREGRTLYAKNAEAPQGERPLRVKRLSPERRSDRSALTRGFNRQSDPADEGPGHARTRSVQCTRLASTRNSGSGWPAARRSRRAAGMPNPYLCTMPSTRIASARIGFR